MKKIIIALSIITLTIASASNSTKGSAIGCAIGLQYKNLMGDKERVYNECKKCLLNAPMTIDKNDQLIKSYIPVCFDKYYELRSKK